MRWMLIARFRLAAPLSSLGVIRASMGQPNADVPRDVARGARFSIQPGGRGKQFEDSYGRFCWDYAVGALVPANACDLLRELVNAPRGRDHHADAPGRHFDVRHWLHALRRGVRAATPMMGRDDLLLLAYLN